MEWDRYHADIDPKCGFATEALCFDTGQEPDVNNFTLSTAAAAALRPAWARKERGGAHRPSYTRAPSNTRAKTPSGVVKKPWERPPLSLCILSRRNQEVPAPRSTGRRPSLRVSYGNDKHHSKSSRYFIKIPLYLSLQEISR